MHLQPWASCPGVDDAPAGCPVTGAQLVWQQVAVGAVSLGAVLLLVGALRRRR